MLLDVSAVSDTNDHTVFISPLHEENIKCGELLDWIDSYLSNWMQCVCINRTMSTKMELEFGFPQESTIGSIGFMLYTKHLSSIARKTWHKHPPLCWWHTVVCFFWLTRKWIYPCLTRSMSRGHLAIDGRKLFKTKWLKTEFMIFGAQQDIALVTCWTVTIGDAEIFPSK